jgi:hypothetical protein
MICDEYRFDSLFFIKTLTITTHFHVTTKQSQISYIINILQARLGISRNWAPTKEEKTKTQNFFSF